MPDQSDWYRNFFKGLFVEVLRKMPVATTAEADFLIDVLKPAPGAKILDVPCGGGRLANELAARGFVATGVDICEALLIDARNEAAARNLPVQFENRDMRDLPPAPVFDHAFCFGNSFAYLGEIGDRDFLQAVHRCLKPGGKFVLHTAYVAELFLTSMLQKRWFPFGDIYFLMDANYDPATGGGRTDYTLIQGDRIERDTAYYSVYTYREIRRMLAAAGFTVDATYGTLTKDPFRLGSNGLWIVAARP
jgi:SAM-dependent methyltransferase